MISIPGFKLISDVKQHTCAKIKMYQHTLRTGRLPDLTDADKFVGSVPINVFTEHDCK